MASHALVKFFVETDSWGKTKSEINRTIATTQIPTALHGLYTAAKNEYIASVSDSVEKSLQARIDRRVQSVDEKLCQLNKRRHLWGISYSLIAAILASVFIFFGTQYAYTHGYDRLNFDATISAPSGQQPATIPRVIENPN